MVNVLIAFAAGYAVSIFTWDKVRAFIKAKVGI
jgi:hypothetical protein